MPSLAAALARFSLPDTLGGADAYRCGGCRRLAPARKRMALYDDPNVLVVHLKRFDGVLGGKIGGHVAFGEELGARSDACACVCAGACVLDAALRAPRLGLCG